ncbi:BZ3500_MvSof-1268-A1-R1_Chr3-3g06557 [Microbotryum saponariae]|uniref:BZ3500_MvSof-1268-A1-R1_Chr3-3g06557 protein n=1 Tax=Microbotryum saponariae TaxID=289078 RepID=A0A2X0LC39_9BASI|nr:BZ3500_MvSof-1268-A1-R1_Chr3-3g06557 [Microbotryum saponariae]SDA04524.1 BZ3501_MvSof-1269-A2-R1_Chr3-2g06244 [Microbotryum saponariae]
MNNNKPFTYPINTGISYSFTNDGYFEESQYRFLGNGQFQNRRGLGLCDGLGALTADTLSLRIGSKPTCSKAVAIWQHGRYYFHDNGSVTMDPSIFSADGRVLVQDPCAAQTEILTYYNQPELFNGWNITIDNHHQAYMLQLVRFDGSFFPRCVDANRCGCWAIRERTHPSLSVSKQVVLDCSTTDDVADCRFDRCNVSRRTRT